MVIAPSTKVKLLVCPLDKDNLHQFDFISEEAQTNYFNSLTSLDFDNFTYQRKDNVIRVPVNIDLLYNYNYVMYQNPTYYPDKWFYAFITRKEYLNDNTTLLYIKQDSFQTWQFNIEIKKSFVEREHVNDDTVGLHTIAENLATGDYVCNDRTVVFNGDSNTTLCIMCSDLPDEMLNDTSVKLNTYNNIFSGCYLLVADPTRNPELSISNFLSAMDKLDKAEAVVNIFIVPNSLIPTTIEYKLYDILVSTGKYKSCYMGIVPSTSGVKNMGTSSNITNPSTLNGYTPKNNKLKVFPYSYFYISNNVGSDIDFHYEDFVNNTAQFKTVGGLTAGGSIRCIPLNYKKLSDTSSSLNSFNSGISVGKYPTCPWKTDLYTNWLTENAVNQGLGYGAGIAGIVTGIGLIASGAGAGAGVGSIIGGISSIASTMAQDYQHSLTPDQARGNTNTGDVTFSAGQLDIVCYKMSIRYEYAKIIDEFFSSFGYKVNDYKIPNLKGRRNWNFVKCNGINIESYLPPEDIQDIKDMFNNGVTLWHNPATFLDYSQNNDII